MMPATILAPLVVAVVLATSAVAKLRDPASVEQGFTQLRVPAALDRPWLRRLVPWLELGLAVALVALPSPLAPLASGGALVLFLVYTVLIVRAWRAHGGASCACFGGLTSGRVTGWTVVRNLILVGASLVAVADALGAAPVVVRLLAPDVLAWALGVAVVAVLVFTVVHEAPADEPAAPAASMADVEVDEEDEYVRLPIPYSRLTTPTGQKVTLRDLPRGRAQLLVLVSFGCGSCGPVIEALPRWRQEMPEVGVRPVVVSGDQVERLGDLADDALVDDEQAMQVFGRLGTPSAVLLGADGLIAGGPVVGTADVTDLAEGMLEQLAEARGAAQAAASG